MLILFLITGVMVPYSAPAYVGAGFGVTVTDMEHSSSKVYAGLRLLPDLGIEIAYNDFGNYHGQRADAYSLVGVATVPVSNTWDLFVKLGATENHTSFAGSTRHSDLLTGFGIVYKENSQVRLRFEYENFGKMMNDSSAINNDVTNWTINFVSLF
jgi:hypothetical protein